MATFDPQVQYAPDPNYLNYSRVVDAPEPDLSKALAVKTAGAALEGTANFVNTAIKQGIQEAAYAKVDPERDQFTAGLEAVKKQLDQGTVPAAVRTVGSPTGSVMDAYDQASDADLPPGVSGGIDRVNTLAMALGAGSPKLNDTQYSLKTLAIAKQMRNMYPGYRQEVDQAVSEASGLPVANSYYQNLMTDINRQLVQMSLNQRKDPVGGMIMSAVKDGMPNADVYWQRHASGDTSLDVQFMKQYNSWTNLQKQGTIDAAERDANNYDKKLQIDNEKKNVTGRANDYVSHFITDNLALSGLMPLRELGNYFQEVSSTGKYNGVAQGDTDVGARAQQLQAYRNNIYQHVWQDAVRSAPIIGQDEVKKIVDTAMSPIDGWITLASGNSPNAGGVAAFHNHQIQNVKDDATYGMLINKDTSAVSRQMVAARALFGDQYFPQWIASILQTPDGKPGDAPVAALFQQEALTAVQPITDARGQPLPQRHMADAVQHAKDVNVPDQNIYSKFIGLATGITDPNMPLAMKDKLVSWAFDPENRNIVNQFKLDYKDANGNVIPGKFALVQRLGSQAMADSVAQTAKINPNNYLKYRDTVENSFALAYRAELADLNKALSIENPAAARPSIYTMDQQAQGSTNAGIHFAWNDQNNHFSLVDKNNRPLTLDDKDPLRAYKASLIDKVAMLNRGVDALTNVYKADPTNQDTDVGRHLLMTLQASGFRPGENITNASEGMAKAIIKTKKPDITMDEMDKVLGIK